MDPYGQQDFHLRLAWGPTEAGATVADVAVVVDVLSFSTAVTVAVERGTRVFPCRWRDARATDIARAHDAVLAVGRHDGVRPDGSTAPSLSPASLRDGAPVDRLVLPSPNGSTIAAGLVEAGATVAVGCLRNAEAVAGWLAGLLDRGGSVTIVAAGERWHRDDSLRPALEDHLGAGAILAALLTRGHGHRMSPEARSAAELYEAARPELAERLADCVSGRELAAGGFVADVRIAAELNASTVVPVLADGAFADSSGVCPPA